MEKGEFSGRFFNYRRVKECPHQVCNVHGYVSLSFVCGQVENIDSIKPVQEIWLLRNLNLLRNPIQGVSDYRLSLLFCLPQLTELDRHRVEAEEKVRMTYLAFLSG